MKLLAKTAYTDFMLYKAYISFYELGDDSDIISASDCHDFVHNYLDEEEREKIMDHYSEWWKTGTGFWPEL